MNLIETGIQKKLIRINDESNIITYIHQDIRRNFNYPEEKVQAETFLKLILHYNYPVKQIKQFVSVKKFSSTGEADIIIYEDNNFKQPLIVVECKSADVSEFQFSEAERQG